MKRCPTCSRTYADNSLSFCLEDGGLLSPEFESDETLAFSKDYVQPSQTDPNFSPQKSIATVVASSPRTSPTVVHQKDANKSGTSPHLIYAGAGLVAVALIVVAVLWSRSSTESELANKVMPSNISNTTSTSRSNSSAVNTKQDVQPEPLKAKMTTPRGPILGQDTGRGLYYRNYNDTLETGVAYKYTTDNTVYVYDGTFLRNVGSEEAFKQFYSCPSSTVTIIHCAPIYEMPSSVTTNMIKGQLSDSTSTAPTTRRTNVPTTQQLQEELLREAKRIEDQANR